MSKRIDWIDILLHVALIAPGPMIVGGGAYLFARELAQHVGEDLGLQSTLEYLLPTLGLLVIWTLVLLYFWPRER